MEESEELTARESFDVVVHVQMPPKVFVLVELLRAELADESLGGLRPVVELPFVLEQAELSGAVEVAALFATKEDFEFASWLRFFCFNFRFQRNHNFSLRFLSWKILKRFDGLDDCVRLRRQDFNLRVVSRHRFGLAQQLIQPSLVVQKCFLQSGISCEKRVASQADFG